MGGEYIELTNFGDSGEGAATVLTPPPKSVSSVSAFNSIYNFFQSLFHTNPQAKSVDDYKPVDTDDVSSMQNYYTGMDAVMTTTAADMESAAATPEADSRERSRSSSISSY